MDKLEGMEIARSPEEATRESDGIEKRNADIIDERLTDGRNMSLGLGRGNIKEQSEHIAPDSVNEELIEESPEASELTKNPGDGFNNGTAEGNTDAPIDYERVIREDLAELRSAFSELGNITSITELPNPMRYAALRDLGLTAREAYLATSERRTKDNRSHLSSAVPGGIGTPRSNMTRSELESARELFPGLRDGELIGLYKKVNL